jgi:hypothetical protein
MKVLADAIKRAGTTENTKLRDAIAQTSGFPGVTGTISIDKDRNAVKPAVVLKLENSKFVYETTISPEGAAPPTSSAPSSGSTTAGTTGQPAAPAKAASPTN